MSNAHGGRYTGPARFILAGDKVLAQQHVNDARALLGYMQNQAATTGLGYLVQYTTTQDGTVIRGVMNNGQFQAEITSMSGRTAVIKSDIYLVGFKPFNHNTGNPDHEMDYIYRADTFENVDAGTFVSEVQQPRLAVGNMYHIPDDRRQAVTGYLLKTGSMRQLPDAPFSKISGDEGLYSRSAMTSSNILTDSHIVAVTHAEGWELIIVALSTPLNERVYARQAGSTGGWAQLGTAVVNHNHLVGASFTMPPYPLSQSVTVDEIPYFAWPYSAYKFNTAGTKAIRVNSIDGAVKVHMWSITWDVDAVTGALIPTAATHGADLPPAEFATSSSTTGALTWTTTGGVGGDTVKTASANVGDVLTNTFVFLVDVDFVGDSDVIQYLNLVGTTKRIAISGDASAQPTNGFGTTYVSARSGSGAMRVEHDYKYMVDRVTEICVAIDTDVVCSGTYSGSSSEATSWGSFTASTTENHTVKHSTLAWWDMRAGRYIVCERTCNITLSMSKTFERFTTEPTVTGHSTTQVTHQPLAETNPQISVRLYDIGYGSKTLATHTYEPFDTTVVRWLYVFEPGFYWVGHQAAYETFTSMYGTPAIHWLGAMDSSPVLLSAAMETSYNSLVSYAFAAPPTGTDPELPTEAGGNDRILLLSGRGASASVGVVRDASIPRTTDPWQGAVYLINPTYVAGLV